MNNEIGFFVVPFSVVNGHVFERINGGVWRLTTTSLSKLINEALADAPDSMSDDEVTLAAVDLGAKIEAEMTQRLEQEWQKFYPSNAVGMTEYASR